MKLLSNLLSQRREWKMMLLERQVHTRRWWAFPDTGNCLWKLPRAHQNCKFLFSSFAAPPPPNLPVADRRERAKGRIWQEAAGSLHQTEHPGSVCPGHTFAGSRLDSVSFSSRTGRKPQTPVPPEQISVLFWVALPLRLRRQLRVPAPENHTSHGPAPPL